MKKFRFAPIHLAMAGLISFIILAICLRLFGDSLAMLAALMLVLALLIVLFIQQQRVSELDEIEQIHYVNHQAEGSLASLLDKMPVGVIKISEDNGDVEWFNPYAELIFTTEDGDFDADMLKNIMKAAYSDSGHYATVGDKKYSVYLDRASSVFYFFDASNEYEATVGLVTTRPVIGIISVDNYDDLEDVVSDTDISQINSFVANFVAEFSEQFHMFYRRVSMDRFYLFTDYTVLEQLMENKFSIIDQFRTEAKNRELSLTLSMGFSYGDGNHDEIGRVALLNLNLAEVRGGDQAVVKENNDNMNPIFFGGGTASAVKRTRTRTRAMMTAISDKIKSTAEQSLEANKLSLSSVEAVELSNQKMEEMSMAMKEITEKSNEIGKIIKTIDDIAFQTNILSLNAAIEAARAGAAGKGFAVVADEVGNLAQKSAKAAQNTSDLIEETIDAVSRGAKITQETAESMDLVKSKAEGITNIISKISDASEDEARGIVQLSSGLDQISSVVQSNTATAEQSAAASEELSGQANVLQDLVSKFQLKNEEKKEL